METRMILKGAHGKRRTQKSLDHGRVDWAVFNMPKHLFTTKKTPLSAALLGFLVVSITTNTILPLTYSFAFLSTCFPFQNLFFRVPKHVLSGFRIRHLKDGERALCSLKDEPACGRWKTTPLSGLFKTTSVTE